MIKRGIYSRSKIYNYTVNPSEQALLRAMKAAS